MSQIIAVLDFGSQYTQVIARRIRECNVYSKIYPFGVSAEELKKDNVRGIILSGGPSSVLLPKSPRPDAKLFELGVPVLGICYGVQLIGHLLGGKVEKSKQREYGKGTLNVRKKGKLLAGLPKKFQVWNSHGDRVIELPKGFEAIASTENSDVAVVQDAKRNIFGMQFHPEVVHTEHGMEIIRNFLLGICRCKGDWQMSDYVETAVQQIREQVGDKRVILGLSGGVDSSVAAALIHKAIGKQLTCVFVDNGLLRKGERKLVEQTFKGHFDLDLRVVDAEQDFLNDLKGIEAPQEKRTRIGHRFIEVFKQASADIQGVRFLAQGTLY
ncbi:MAG: glutamine-hydrolyzing GMP synthase, partial [Puniceicoccales bacterium]